jgi:hypothetical protein
MGKNKMYANKRYLVGKDAEELIEASRKSSDEQLYQVISQNVLNREGQRPRLEKAKVAA